MLSVVPVLGSGDTEVSPVLGRCVGVYKQVSRLIETAGTRSDLVEESCGQEQVCRAGFSIWGAGV